MSTSAPRVGELFAGYGGAYLGLKQIWPTAHLAWVSEVSPAPSKVLAHRYPHAPNLGDITAIDWSRVEPVDIMTGGSPCQDLSKVGRRAGMREGTRSGLWASMCDGIEHLRPSFVMWENVEGAYSATAHSDMEPCPRCVGDRDHHPVMRALGRVLGDLADLGFDAAWCRLRASDVGAPHARARVFVIAADPGGARNWGDAHARRVGRENTHLMGIGHGRGDPTAVRGFTVSDDAHLANSFGPYAAAVARWETITGRAAPDPLDGSRYTAPRFLEWAMGLDAGWVTDVPGITDTEARAMCGNGIVPAQAASAVEHLIGLLDASEVAA